MSLDWNKLKILVVEDDPDLLEVICEVLINEGATVHTARNGKLALDVLATTDVHLVFSDLQMPIMTGMVLLKEIRKVDPTWPLVMLATGQSETDEREAKKQGAAGIITKPFLLADLLQDISTICTAADVIGQKTNSLEAKFKRAA